MQIAWQQIPLAQSLATYGHWAEWALVIAGRYQLTVPWQGNLNMTLVNTGRLVHLYQPIEQRTLTIHPSIKLLIQQHMRVPVSHQLLSQLPTRVERNSHAHNVETAAVAEPPLGSQSLRQLVISRQNDDVSRVEPTAAQVQFQESRALQMTTRLIEQRQRIQMDQRVSTKENQLLIMQVRRQVKETKPVQATNPDLPGLEMISPRGLHVGSSGMAHPSNRIAMPAHRMLAAPNTGVNFSIEQLADQVLRQIDNRFVAHRERMGGVF